MNEKNETKPVEIDTRTIERKMKSGEITKEEYEKYCASIEECTEYDTIDEEALIKEAGIKRDF